MKNINLPNKLTIFRIILIPIFLLLLMFPLGMGTFQFLGTSIPVSQILAALVFIVACLTDFLDGQIARKENLVTNFGKFADPLADKMLVMTAFIMLVEIDPTDVPAWVIAIIVCRELAVTGLRLIVVQNDGEVVAAAWPGKIKTFFQMISIILLLLNIVDLGVLCLYICLIFTVYSGCEYFWKNRQVFSDSF